jgi:endonuclease/exonuclease/phosphatase family metal-dependent hydrolase
MPAAADHLSMDRLVTVPPTVARVVEAGLRVGRPGSMSALVAVTTALAIELLRVFPPLLTWHPGARGLGQLAWSAAYAAPFLGAVALVVAVRLDARRCLLAAGIMLAGARLALQLSAGESRIVFAAVGLSGALALLAIVATMGLPLFGGGVLAGVAIDLALQAALGTRPLAWVGSTAGVVVVGVLVAWLAALVIHRSRREVFVLGRSFRSAMPLLLVGPVLVLQAHLTGTLGWVSHALGHGWRSAFVVIALGVGGGILAAAWVARSPSGRWPTLGWAGGAALVALPIAHAAPGWWWAPVLVLAQMGVAVALTAGVSRGVGSGGLAAPVLTLAAGSAGVLAALTVLDGRGIAGAAIAPPVVLALVGVVTAISTSISRGELSPRPHRAGRSEAVSLLVVFGAPALLAVLGGSIAASGAPPPSAGVGVLRVVTYNVALAFDAEGQLNVVEVGETLARLDADVIALQEVPRGQLPAGGVDMLGYLERRLAMRHSVFQPAAPGAMHGNAVLSRHPITEVDQRRFTRSGTALPRGAVRARVEVAAGEPVWVIAAHLPPGGSPAERALRVGALVELWGDRERTVIAADLNSQPGSSIVGRLEAEGLRSAWDPASGPGHTYPARAPRARIDWILHTPDLVTVAAEVPVSTASDHRPLVATIDLG